MSKIAQRTDPELWEKIKTKITMGQKGGEAGQWSARKAQLAVQEYKKQGGAYLGGETAGNFPDRWTDEANGKANIHKRSASENTPSPKRKTGAFSSQVDAGLRRENAIKQGTRTPLRLNRSGKGSGAQAAKPKRGESLSQARHLDIEGRSNMLKAELQDAIRLAKH